MKDIEILFKEYDALRSEVLTGLSGRNTILSVGIAVVGINCTLAGGFAKSNSELPGFIFALGVPVITSSVLLIWFGEYKRVQRAGIRLYRLESKINTEAGKKLLTSEIKTRDDRQKEKIFVDPTVLLLFVLSFLSWWIGLNVLPTCESKWVQVLLRFVIPGYIVISDFIINWRINQWRKKR